MKNLPANEGDARDTGLIPGLGGSPGEGNSNPVFLPGKFHGQRSLAGYCPWGHKESDTAEHTRHMDIFTFVLRIHYIIKTEYKTPT